MRIIDGLLLVHRMHHGSMELMVYKYRLVDQERRDLFVKNLKEEGLICEIKS